MYCTCPEDTAHYDEDKLCAIHAIYETKKLILNTFLEKANTISWGVKTDDLQSPTTRIENTLRTLETELLHNPKCNSTEITDKKTTNKVNLECLEKTTPEYIKTFKTQHPPKHSNSSKNHLCLSNIVSQQRLNITNGNQRIHHILKTCLY